MVVKGAAPRPFNQSNATVYRRCHGPGISCKPLEVRFHLRNILRLALGNRLHFLLLSVHSALNAEHLVEGQTRNGIAGTFVGGPLGNSNSHSDVILIVCGEGRCGQAPALKALLELLQVLLAFLLRKFVNLRQIVVLVCVVLVLFELFGPIVLELAPPPTYRL